MDLESVRILDSTEAFLYFGNNIELQQFDKEV